MTRADLRLFLLSQWIRRNVLARFGFRERDGVGDTMCFQNRYLTDEQRSMRDTTRHYVEQIVKPFIERNRLREWDIDPQARLDAHILQQSDAAGL